VWFDLTYNHFVKVKKSLNLGYLLFPDQIVKQRQRFLCVYLNTVDNSVNEIVVDEFCILVAEEEAFSAIDHNKYQLVTFLLFNSILSIVDNIGFVH